MFYLIKVDFWYVDDSLFDLRLKMNEASPVVGALYIVCIEIFFERNLLFQALCAFSWCYNETKSQDSSYTSFYGSKRLKLKTKYNCTNCYFYSLCFLSKWNVLIYWTWLQVNVISSEYTATQPRCWKMAVVHVHGEMNCCTPFPLSLFSSTLFILGLLIEGNRSKNQSNTISQIVLRLVWYLNMIKMELFGEFNNYFRTQLNQSISIDPISSILFCRKTNKTHPVSIESEKSPSSMHVKQFEKYTNISINPE